ncbi:MAG: type II toxin-antitoxin system RelE/ParE family toxin [Rhodospirillaceae bacterium]|nr:type II toxin-antitoxin system RelE/ParE family toxin [Rhodospirillaceae bacterium]
MKRRYHVSTRAARDLADIATYTQHTWGTPQRREYLSQLETAMNNIADNPEIGIARLELPGLRSLNCGSQVIFYALQHDKVFVVRVLHRRQDPRRQFDS